MKSRLLIGNLMMLTVTLIYSFNTNFMKVLMPQWIEPHGLVVARCAMSTLGFWLIGLFVHEKQNVPRPRDILMIMLGGALGLGGNLLFYINGLARTGPVDAFVIRTAQPIIVIALAIIFLHKKLTAYKAAGILLGIAGTLYISIMPHETGVKNSFQGDLLVFMSSVCTSLFLILIQPYTQKFNSITVMKWMSLSSLILTLPFGYHQFVTAPLFHPSAPLYIWLEFGFILILATMVTYFLSVKALNYITPFVESAYRYLLPITGAAVSISMGLQRFSWHDPIALALIIIGFILINKKTSPTPS